MNPSKLKSLFNLFIFLLISSALFSQPGEIDPSFNFVDYSTVQSTIGLASSPKVSHVMPDDKIILGGNFSIYSGGVNYNKLVRYRQNGDIDTNFNVGYGFDNHVNAINHQTDGKLLVGGVFSSFNNIPNNSIVRLNTNGTLDQTFYSQVVFNSQAYSIYCIAVQQDGKILVGGNIYSNLNGTVIRNIFRLNPDGSLDESFQLMSEMTGYINSIVIQPDGKIIIAGTFISVNGISYNRIVRLNDNGTIDTSFNVGSGFNDFVNEIILQNDGKIVAAGRFDSFNGVSKSKIARINTDGTLDLAFVIGSGFDGDLFSLNYQPNGKIICGGEFTNYNGITIKCLVRLENSGSIDLSFDTGLGFDPGVVNSVVVTSSCIQTNGRIIAVGNFSSFNGVGRSRIVGITNNGALDITFNMSNGFNSRVTEIASQSDSKVIVGGHFVSYNKISANKIVRLNPDGNIDGSFNTAQGFEYNAIINKIVIQSDNKILIGGNFSSYNGLLINDLIRLNTDGSIDGNFDSGIGFNGQVQAIMQQPDGKIVVGGAFSSINGVLRNNLVRLNSDGSIDYSFDIGTGFDGNIEEITIQTDGKIIVAGYFSNYNGNPVNGLIRLNTNGSLDVSFNVVFPNQGVSINNLALQTNGKVVISGWFNSILFDDYQIVRLNEDGSIDNSFNVGTGFNGQIDDIEIDSNGKIIVVGNFNGFNNVQLSNLARLNIDGTLDANFNNGNFLQVESVEKVCIQPGGNYIIGGDFEYYNGIRLHRIARLFNCSSASIITANVCDNYLWNGENIYQSGVHLDTINNVSGCDSILILDLHINSTIDTIYHTSCDTFIFGGQTYTTSGIYTQSLTNVAGCDSILTLNLTINNSNAETITSTACDTYTLNGQTYTSSGTYTQALTNAAGCDSILTLNLTIIPSIPQQTNVFSLPSDPNNCLGQLAIQTTGNPDFTADIDGNTLFTYSGYHLEQNLCPGVHTLTVTDDCGNSNATTFVIPVDTNYVFNNPFIDSIAVDSLGQTIENCDIYYNSIDTAFIDSLWANGNTVNVIWNIVDSNGSTLDTNTYELNNGNGVYWLQLSVFCPTRAIGDYFTVTEAINFEDGSVTMAGLDDPELFSVSVYPNPSDGLITVTVDVPEAELSVFDAQGKLIRSKTRVNGQTTVDLTHADTGLYFLRLETEKGSVVKRVVKQ